jgi:hypothetical protein
MKPLMKLQAKLSVEVSVLLGLGTNYQVTQHHIPEEPRHQLHSCKGQKTRKTTNVWNLSPYSCIQQHNMLFLSLSTRVHALSLSLSLTHTHTHTHTITTNSKITVLQLIAFRRIFIFYGFYGMFFNCGNTTT